MQGESRVCFRESMSSGQPEGPGLLQGMALWHPPSGPGRALPLSGPQFAYLPGWAGSFLGSLCL